VIAGQPLVVLDRGQRGQSDVRVRVDVFGLGAVAFYLLAGKPAASSASGLRDRLRS